MSSRTIVYYNHTPEVIVAFREGSKKAALALAGAVAKEASRRSSVGPAGPFGPSGTLRASWQVKQEGDHAVVVSTDPNAVYQEYGTWKMRARPSLGPALRAEEPRVGEHVVVVLNPLIEDACR